MKKIPQLKGLVDNTYTKQKNSITFVKEAPPLISPQTFKEGAGPEIYVNRHCYSSKNPFPQQVESLWIS